MQVNSAEKIFVAGHKGMVGGAIVRALKKNGVSEESIITCSKSNLDLTNQAAVHDFFSDVRPSQVYLAAAKVGGIHANNEYPAEFIYQNLMIECNVIHSSFSAGVKKLLFLGSSCIYPKYAEQPICESALLTGRLEPTNEPYAVAKIAGIKLCESYNRQYGESHGIDYRSVMPTNLYGIGDNYHPENSHVVPALIRRFHEAKLSGLEKVSVWGSGRPKREFLFADDLADACLHVMNLPKDVLYEHVRPMESHINIGFGSDVTIEELALIIMNIVGYQGVLEFDSTKPDGTPRKIMRSEIMNALGWQPRTSLAMGLELAYQDFLKNLDV